MTPGASVFCVCAFLLARINAELSKLTCTLFGRCSIGKFPGSVPEEVLANLHKKKAAAAAAAAAAASDDASKSQAGDLNRN